MNKALETLETQLSENLKQLSSLMREVEIIKKNNEHLTYAIGLIKKPSPVIRQLKTITVLPTVGPYLEKDNKTLRAVVLGVIKNGESITVGDAWERVKAERADTTRATINATLHNLVKKGDLVKPEIGQYKKAV